MMEPDTADGGAALAEEARQILAWYRAMGVEDALGEAAIDWLARGDAGPGRGFELPSVAPSPPRGAAPVEPQMREPPPRGGASEPLRGEPPRSVEPFPERQLTKAAPARSAPAQPAAAAGATRQFTSASPDEAVMSARAAAGQAQSLDDLRTRLEGFNGCGLKATAKSLCFYRGAARARLMLIGEAPGREEDLSGVPFVGPAGKLLDRMLAAIGLDEKDVHITNTVYWRPPGNRTPSPQETLACRPFLDRQIELVGPELIAVLGGAAANQLLDAPGGIMKLRGTWRDVEIAGRKIKVMATLHPAFLLRTPIHKRLAWRDMLAIAAALDA